MRPRDQARADTMERIKALARAQLAETGPTGMSLRAIARDLGLVSSGLYRYVSSRDELLTILIADGYDRLGSAVEEADRQRPQDDFHGRWLEVGRTVRGWALAHPAEYGLLFGTPVPGYAAPGDVTVPPATRAPAVMARLLADAHAAGALKPVPERPLPVDLRRDAAAAAAALEVDLPDDLLGVGIVAWIHLFGAVSFEVFGQLNNVIGDKAAWLDLQMEMLASLVGL